MAYIGERMTVCDPKILAFSDANAVLVSGDGINVCGHAILQTIGSPARHYFQVTAGIYDYPTYMDEAGFERYMKENGKKLWMIAPGNLKDALPAQLLLSKLMAEKWVWGVLPHNCVTFVEKIIQAGGGEFGLNLNCAVIPKKQREMELWFGRLESAIKGLYGVPSF